jgi:L-fuconolactonase
VQNGISKLANYNLTYDILVFPSQLNAAIALVKKFPNQQFILDHIAKPRITKSMDELWKSNIIELSKNQNVTCKLSGLVTETNNYVFNDNDFKPYIDLIFETFGSKRILFGSDWPVCLLAANYKKVYDLIFDYLDNHSIETKAQIFGLNAIKIYNL